MPDWYVGIYAPAWQQVQYMHVATTCPTAADALDVMGSPAFLDVCLHHWGLLHHSGAVEHAAAPGSWGHGCLTAAQSAPVLCMGTWCPRQLWALLSCLCFWDGCLCVFQVNLRRAAAASAGTGLGVGLLAVWPGSRSAGRLLLGTGRVSFVHKITDLWKPRAKRETAVKCCYLLNRIRTCRKTKLLGFSVVLYLFLIQQRKKSARAGWHLFIVHKRWHFTSL